MAYHIPPPVLHGITNLFHLLILPANDKKKAENSSHIRIDLVLPQISFVESNVYFSSQVMLVGDSGVGKTCLLVRYKDGAFLSGVFISTVGIDYRVRYCHIFVFSVL
ncbi:hypothetical protein NPIL_178141 [Nephila pilipes]|uniref:Ras-related protein Rab-26 n=1 Tax=Nephila pilipes TaxID=299642 RepID=A0A8X6TTR1_NEPPI|nr:hypothetical protein NPIL_178141 [Nephila pilipes]